MALVEWAALLGSCGSKPIENKLQKKVVAVGFVVMFDIRTGRRDEGTEISDIPSTGHRTQNL